MTAEELAAVVEALKMKAVPRPCEMCGVDNWIIAPQLASPIMVRRDHGGLSPNYGSLQTTVSVICGYCGNTKMFHLGTLGVQFRS